jgi:hypothetical protein
MTSEAQALLFDIALSEDPMTESLIQKRFQFFPISENNVIQDLVDEDYVEWVYADKENENVLVMTLKGRDYMRGLASGLRSMYWY